ncbi:Ankyrin repeatcontaining protein [Acanthamoeba castellanii str. Neff]|uniref:Ankyrin repeatcontaining protein n=1 Tax=Acanthamoeba castellanii (strain ATCC 30010 / Neff) TaxID=1257118 RepID=L8GQY7_ACACF|nr:Ankyrin repeatcontaining protein [Acanthamoeba castellanii str. Neff]ELR15554.1 Ankyrin repeatcontaining protein [Acanthamoeba castellanii str. Neff]
MKMTTETTSSSLLDSSSGQFAPVTPLASAEAFPAVIVAGTTTSASRLALMSSDDSLPSSGTSTPFSKMPSPFRRRVDGDQVKGGLFVDFESSTSPPLSPTSTTSLKMEQMETKEEDEVSPRKKAGWRSGEKKTKKKKGHSKGSEDTTSTDDGEGSSRRKAPGQLVISNGRVPTTAAAVAKTESERESDGEKRRADKKNERERGAETTSTPGMMRCTSDGVSLVRKDPKRAAALSPTASRVNDEEAFEQEGEEGEGKKEKKEKKEKKAASKKEKVEGSKRGSLVRRAKSERKMNRMEKLDHQLGTRGRRADIGVDGVGGGWMAESARTVQIGGIRRGISLENEEMTIERLRQQALLREHEQLREKLERVEQQKNEEEEKAATSVASDVREEKNEDDNTEKNEDDHDKSRGTMEERVRRLEGLVERLVGEQADIRRQHAEAVDALKREHEDALQQMILQMKHLRESLLLSGGGGGGQKKKAANRVMSGILPITGGGSSSNSSPDLVHRRASMGASGASSVLTRSSSSLLGSPTSEESARPRDSDAANDKPSVAPLILVNTPYQIDQRSATARPRSRSVKERPAGGEPSRKGLTFRSLSSRFLDKSSSSSSLSSASAASRQRVDSLTTGSNSWHHSRDAGSKRVKRRKNDLSRKSGSSGGSGSESKRESDSDDDDDEGDDNEGDGGDDGRLAMKMMTRGRSQSSPRLHSVAPPSPLSSGRRRSKADEEKRSKPFWPFSPRDPPKTAAWAKLLDEPSEATAAAAGVDGDTHQQQQKERTPDEVARLAAELHEACQSLDVERAEAVLKAAKQKGFEKLRAALAGLNAQGETPLHVASERNPVGLVPMLLQYVQKAESELHRSNPNPAVQSLVNFRNDRDWTPLHSAAWAGQLLNCRLLLKANADASLLTVSGVSVLHKLFDPQHDDETIQRHSREELMNLVADMVDLGAPVNARSVQSGETALHLACSRGNVTAVQCLLEHGADPNLCATSTRETSLHYAARGGKEAIARLLLASGADPEVVGAHGTPLEVAKAAGQECVVPFLVQARTRTSDNPGGGCKKSENESERQETKNEDDERRHKE